MRGAWWLARTELLRLLRERSNLFFVFVFPLLLVTLIGVQFGGSVEARLGVAAPADEDAEAFVASLEAIDGVAVVRVADGEAVEDEVRRGVLGAGVVLEDDFGASVRAVRPTTVRFVGRPDAASASLRTLVDVQLARFAAPGAAAALAATYLGVDAAPLRDLASSLAEQLPGIEVDTRTVGVDELAQEFAGLGQFDLGASSQLFLFTFLTSLTGAAALIQSRQLGVTRRMLATPTPLGAIVAGQVGGRLLVALVQAGYIVVATLLLFQVDWGAPLATGVVVVLFSLVAAAAGVVVGATFRNDSQASSAGVGLGIGLAALGGSMVPLELFPAGMRMVSRVTPHAWANEAMAEIVRRDGGLADVWVQVGALSAFAAALLALGTWQLRRALLAGR